MSQDWSEHLIAARKALANAEAAAALHKWDWSIQECMRAEAECRQLYNALVDEWAKEPKLAGQA